MLLIGSHVSFNKDQLLGSVKEAIRYGANTFMFYTGAPQNTVRSNIDDYKTMEAYKLMSLNHIPLEHVVCHAPYIVNLANNKDYDKYRFSIDFLIKELERCALLGISKVVLHPGSAVGLDRIDAIKNIIYALNIILDTTDSVTICLETMAGKGTEIGVNLEEIKMIIDGVNKKELIGVCLDTCHLNDSGVDIKAFDKYLDEFSSKIGLENIKVVHINDSKNVLGSHKDRHENIGYGTIGFDALLEVIYSPRLEGIPKILETPYISKNEGSKDRDLPPYKFEIEMIRAKKFNSNLYKNIREYYEQENAITQ